MTKPVEITDSSFSSFVKENPVAVVDCWAPWCGPCKRIAPILDELAGELEGQIVIGKLNTDENSEAPRRYGVMSIPTLLVFKDGQRVDQVVGFLPKEQLKDRLLKHA